MMFLHAPRVGLHCPIGKLCNVPKVVYNVLLASSGNAPKGGLHCPTGKLYNASGKWVRFGILVVNTKN